MIANLVAGMISLVVALLFLGVLVKHLIAPPLWIIILVGVIAMLVSWAESVRSNGSS